MEKMLLALSLVLSSPLIASAHSDGGSFANDTGMMAGNWGMGSGWFFMILFWIIVTIGIIALIKLLINWSKPSQTKNSALDILKKRYAKGEINKQEFIEKKKDLI